MKNIGAIRGVFDPPHKWHISWIEAACEHLKLDHMRVIVKFIWEKNPAISVKERIRLLKMWIEPLWLPIDVVIQNIHWHFEELLSMKREFNRKPIQICGTDKVVEEMVKYGLHGDTFWEIKRPDFWVTNSIDIWASMWINVVPIFVPVNTSSTRVREIINKTVKAPRDLLTEKVAEIVDNKELYHQDMTLKLSYEYYRRWWDFLNVIKRNFPEIQISTIDEPIFIPIQSEEWWIENYLRHLIRKTELRWDLLEGVLKYFWVI